jgi:hypothetical protein
MVFIQPKAAAGFSSRANERQVRMSAIGHRFERSPALGGSSSDIKSLSASRRGLNP